MEMSHTSGHEYVTQHKKSLASFPGFPLLFCITGLGASVKSEGKPGNFVSSQTARIDTMVDTIVTSRNN